MIPNSQKSNFFYLSSWIFLIVVFLGFAPSFYLKFLVEEQPFYPKGLPLPYIIHGMILTIWYVFLVVQTRLVKTKNLKIHKKSGYFGALWAILVLVSTFYAISLFPDRMESLAAELGQTVSEIEPGLSSILWLDILMSLFFVSCLALGIQYRTNPKIHKRLMFFTGLAYLFAASSRVGGTAAHLMDSNLGHLIGPFLLLGLSGGLLVHDYRVFGKVLPLSWILFVVYWILMVISQIVGAAEWGEDFVFFLFKS
ncbi:hypothetical protein [Aquiflexum sp.]|uniref:hypothetical protein n=1 Tax=Aquiflexum sp. TaxID=1872584 RepID=UPI003593D3CF